MSDNCNTDFAFAVSAAIEKSIVDSNFSNSPYYAILSPKLDQFRLSSVAVNTATDETILIENTAALNTFVRNEQTVPNFAITYPNLAIRLVAVAFISVSETQSFMDQNFLDPVSFTNTLTPRNTNILVLLDSYYGPGAFSTSGMASFCSIVPNIFSKFSNLKDAFNQIDSFASDFANLLSGIENISHAGLLETIKSQISTIIDQIVKKTKAKMLSFSAGFTNKSGFKYNTDNIQSKVLTECEKIGALTSEISVTNLKTFLEGAVSFAGSLFEKLKIEEIEFLILRFCELISNIETFFDGLTSPLQTIVDNHTAAYSILTGSSLKSTARALAAGAIRYESELTISSANEIEKQVPMSGYGSGVGTDGVQEPGGASAMRTRSAKIQPITSDETNEAASHLTYEAVTNGSSPYVSYQPGPQSASGGRFGWDNVRPLEKIMIMRLSKELGVKLYVNSAWRSLATQARIRKGSEGSIPKSGYHQAGQAFDVSRKSIQSENTFINTARGIGFGGVGRYPTFIHIDSRFNTTTFR